VAKNYQQCGLRGEEFSYAELISNSGRKGWYKYWYKYSHGVTCKCWI